MIDGYEQFKDGQKTKFKVEINGEHTLADVAKQIPDDWQIETDDDDTANIWPPQASVYVAGGRGG